MNKLPKIKNPDQITLDNYPPEAKLYVDTIQQEFSEMLKKDPHINNTWNILRFLRARQFDIQKTKIMFGNFLKARQQRDMNKLAQVEFSQDLMQNSFIRGYYNCTEEGYPIFVDPLGSQNVKKLLEDYRDNLDFIRDYYWAYQERVVNIILTKASQQAGRRIDKVVVILDLKGLNITKIFNSDFKKIMKITTEVTQDMYPELLEKMVIINAPFVFKAVWAFVKALIDKKTANKIVIESGNGKKQISKLVDYDQLPLVIGGTCEVPIYENPGCWQKEFNKSFIDKTLYLKTDKIFNEYFLTDEEKKNLNKTSVEQNETIDYINQLNESEQQINDKELVQNQVRVRLPK